MKLTFLMTALAAAISLPDGLSTDDAISIEPGLEYYGAEVPLEAAAGGNLELDIYFGSEDALDPYDSVFIHVSATDPEGERQKHCGMVRDVQPTRDADSGLVQASVEIAVPDECEPGRLDVHVGMWNKKSRERYRVVGRATTDNRILAGWTDLVEGSPDTERRTVTPSASRWQEFWRHVEPWTGWLLGLGLMLVVSLLLRRFGRRHEDEVAEARGGEVLAQQAQGDADVERAERVDAGDLDPDEEPEESASKSSERKEKPGFSPWAWLRRRPPRWAIVASTAALLVPLMATILVTLDFIKDDAYISFRYAHNLANGDGFVFNIGDRLEGFTNFLWTLLMVPFEAMGLDLFQVTEVLGTLLAGGLILSMVLLAHHFHGPQRNLSQLWGALWLATSSSMGLWATSGMEQPLAMFLPALSCYLLWGGRERENPRWALAAGILMGLGCMTRPEIHLIGTVVGATLVIEVLRTRSISPTTRSWLIGLLAITVPFHAFRILYYGELLPNTFYVKTGASSLVWLSGLDKLGEMFEFNGTGWLVVLAPAAFIDRRRTIEKLVVAAIALGFMVYIVKVGVDEMRWHRLYLPALPFLVLLAALGLHNICAWISRQLPRTWVPAVAFAGAWVLVGYAAWANFEFSYQETNGFNGRADLAGTYHPDMGKYVTRHDRPGALVAFQDMGSTPYHAPDIDFLDFIGLVDGTVARARHAYGLHPFVATENAWRQAEYDAEMREYFKERLPEWTILTSYVPMSVAERTAKQFEEDPRTDHLKNRRNNSYQFDIESDPWFHENYVHVRTWPRSATYYLALYRRKDLYEQIPGEVVLDEVPAGIGGPTATFEGGLELLGVEVERTAKERHEFFITTWWRAPGPMDPQTYFFVHANAPNYQAPFDHLPGDWLYPAERWRTGDIIEDRILAQVPVHMAPGTYDLNLGVWNRRTGERLPVLEGPNDGQQRVPIGQVEIVPLRAVLDQLIPPTDVEVQRKYPDRILDHGRH